MRFVVGFFFFFFPLRINISGSYKLAHMVNCTLVFP